MSNEELETLLTTVLSRDTHFNHSTPGIIGQDLEFSHIGHHIVVQVVDVLEEQGNHAQRAQNDDCAAGRGHGHEELGTH